MTPLRSTAVLPIRWRKRTGLRPRMLALGIVGAALVLGTLAVRWKVLEPPNTVAGLALAAGEATEHGDFARAVELYDRLVALDPTTGNHYREKAYLEDSLGRGEAALRTYTLGIERAPLDWQIRFERGFWYYGHRRRDWPNALDDVRVAADQALESGVTGEHAVQVLRQVAHLARRVDDAALVRATCARIQQIDPDDRIAREYLAELEGTSP